MPGDVLDGDLPAETLEWLLKAGAIRESAPADFDATEVTDGSKASSVTADAVPSSPSEEAQGEEIDEDDESPEIDAMAGIVKDADEPDEKPARKPGRAGAKKGGKAR